MRRVSVARTKPGMVVGAAVYDVRGSILLEDGDTLTRERIELLAGAGTGEVLIRDPRVADVPVANLYPGYLEAKATEGMHRLLSNPTIEKSGLEPLDLIALRPAISQMVQCLYPAVLGDPDLSGCASLAGYDFVHPVKTAGLALLIGRTASLNQNGLAKLGMASLLMNVGYLRLRGHFFTRADSLTAAERTELERHPIYSRRMLEASGLDNDVLQAVEQHHERWDGRGYPGGLSRGEISSYSQIISIADTYYALLSRRPHRDAFQPHEAAEFILASSGEMFDPELVQFFARKIPHYALGVSVRLSTGEIGIVTDGNSGQVARPVVRICYEDGRAVEPYDLDLSLRECMDKIIVEAVT